MFRAKAIETGAMRVASILLKQQPAYRHYCFVSGLRKVGFNVINRHQNDPKPGDVLVLWNRHPFQEHIATQYERAGATVLIAENGYIGNTKAIAEGYHNGAGKWHVGEEDRWGKLGIGVRPWRKDGDFILVLPQRGMGSQGIAMPRNWLANTLLQLSKITKRPVRIRKHPGQADCIPIEEELKGAWAAVTWASGAGIKAIVEGVPVFCGLRNWVGAQAASLNLHNIEDPYLGDRMPMLRRLAWAQWTYAEIENGEPFRALC